MTSYYTFIHAAEDHAAQEISSYEIIADFKVYRGLIGRRFSPCSDWDALIQCYRINVGFCHSLRLDHKSCVSMALG